MPLMHNPPFTVFSGSPKSFCQSVTRATPQRCPPEEWPPMKIRSGSPPKLEAPNYHHLEMAESLGNPYGPNGRAALALMKRCAGMMPKQGFGDPVCTAAILSRPCPLWVISG